MSVERRSVQVFNVETRIQNDSIALYVINRSGGESIDELPFEVGKELTAVDSVQANLSTKIKLLAYRFWYQDGKFSLIKEYLGETEGPKLDDLTDSVMMDEADLAELYRKIDYLVEIADELMPVGKRNIFRYKSIFEQVRRAVGAGFTPEEIMSEKDRILKNSINQAEQFRVKERIGIMRRAGVSDRGISEKLGINLVEVRKATFELISMREISPGIRTRGKNLEFEAFCDQVKSLRSHSYTNVEIADELSCSVRKVNRAIRRLIMRNEVEPRFRSRRQIRRKREAIRIQNQIAELWNNTDLTGQQIAAMLGILMIVPILIIWIIAVFIQHNIQHKHLK